MKLSSPMTFLLALMAVREPLRFQRRGRLGIKHDTTWFPGGDGNHPLLGAGRALTAAALLKRGLVEPVPPDDASADVFDLRLSDAGYAALDESEVRAAHRWNAIRNARFFQAERRVR